MAHDDAREGNWRGNWRMEWVASTLHTTPEHGVSNMMRTPRLPVVDWTDAPADLNGLVRFTERRNLVSARVPSRFKCSLILFSTATVVTRTRITFTFYVYCISGCPYLQWNQSCALVKLTSRRGKINEWTFIEKLNVLSMDSLWYMNAWY
jgi:hypothetical protein